MRFGNWIYIDECTLNTDNCAAEATCTDNDGSFTCACNVGWTGSGVTCSDNDECTLNTDNCNARRRARTTTGRSRARATIDSGGNSLNAWIIVGGVVAALVVIVLVIVIVSAVVRRRNTVDPKVAAFNVYDQERLGMTTNNMYAAGQLKTGTASSNAMYNADFNQYASLKKQQPYDALDRGAETPATYASATDPWTSYETSAGGSAPWASYETSAGGSAPWASYETSAGGSAPWASYETSAGGADTAALLRNPAYEGGGASNGVGHRGSRFSLRLDRNMTYERGPATLAVAERLFAKTAEGHYEDAAGLRLPADLVDYHLVVLAAGAPSKDVVTLGPTGFAVNGNAYTADGDGDFVDRHGRRLITKIASSTADDPAFAETGGDDVGDGGATTVASATAAAAAPVANRTVSTSSYFGNVDAVAARQAQLFGASTAAPAAKTAKTTAATGGAGKAEAFGFGALEEATAF
jgi:hypothetical protein